MVRPGSTLQKSTDEMKAKEDGRLGDESDEPAETRERRARGVMPGGQARQKRRWRTRDLIGPD